MKLAAVALFILFASALRAQIKYSGPEIKVLVAVPLTGSFEGQGKKVLAGVQMAFGLLKAEVQNNSEATAATDKNNFTKPKINILEQQDSKFKVIQFDTNLEVTALKTSLSKILEDQKPIAIIGAMENKTATEIASVAKDFFTPTITLAQKTDLTQIDSLIFQNAPNNKDMVLALINEAVKNGGKKFGLLIPNDRYGVEHINFFWDEVLSKKLEVSAVQMYQPTDTDFRNTAKKLVGSFYVEAREKTEEELKKEKAKKEKQQEKKSVRNNEEKEILEPIVNFDYLFIPDNAKNLGLLSASLSYVGLKKIKILGTALWSSADVLKRTGPLAESVTFSDNLPSNNEFESSFINYYKSLYNEQMPGLFEVLGYDSALILKQAVLTGVNSKVELASYLSQKRQIAGAVGNIELQESRQWKRPIFIRHFSNNKK